MKKMLLVVALGVTGLVSANTINEKKESTVEIEDGVLSECNIQTSTTATGETVSVSCCATTFDEAYDCAASKLKAAVRAINNIEDTSINSNTSVN